MAERVLVISTELVPIREHEQQSGPLIYCVVCDRTLSGEQWARDMVFDCVDERGLSGIISAQVCVECVSKDEKASAIRNFVRMMNDPSTETDEPTRVFVAGT
jgi:hypothetical protein